MIRKAAYLFGILIRNSKIFDHFDFLLKSQNWDIKKLQDYQFKKLKVLLNHSYQNSTYYRNKYDKNHIHPNDIKSLADLQSIPQITKEELLENVDTIQIKDFPEKLFYSETSGSTGRPIVFFRNKDWDAWHRASIFRGYSWHNVKPWERNGYLWGYNLSFKEQIKTKMLDYLQNRFRLFSYREEEIDKFIKKLKKASFLAGYSSMIYEIAKRVNASNNDFRFNLKMIKGTSEKIFDKYQSEAQKAFEKKIISEYGSAEAGIVAFECAQGNMHINMETIIVEEENHSIIVTNLCSMSFPIIRYKLGDYIEMDRNIRCACGMKHHVIKEVLGRVGTVIYGFKDQYPSLTLYYVFKNIAMNHKMLLNYQAIQHKKGFLHLNIEDEMNDIKKNVLIKECKRYFNNDLDIEINDGVNLKFKDKKKVDFISEL